MGLLNIGDVYFIFTYSKTNPHIGTIDYHKIIEVIDETKCKLIITKRILLQTDTNDKYYNNKEYIIPYYDYNVVKGKICESGAYDLSIQYNNDKRHWVSGFSIDNIYGDNDGGFVKDEEEAIIEYYTEIVRGWE
jgi:hypothetical protein